MFRLKLERLFYPNAVMCILIAFAYGMVASGIHKKAMRLLCVIETT